LTILQLEQDCTDIRQCAIVTDVSHDCHCSCSSQQAARSDLTETSGMLKMSCRKMVSSLKLF